MKNIILISTFILILILNNSCNSDDTIKGYKASEILVVTVNVKEPLDFKKIVLDFEYTWGIGGYRHIYQSINKNEILNNSSIKLKIPIMDLVGTSTVCLYTENGKKCSETFVCGGGDRVELTITNEKINVVKRQRRFDLK